MKHFLSALLFFFAVAPLFGQSSFLKLGTFNGIESAAPNKTRATPDGNWALPLQSSPFGSAQWAGLIKFSDDGVVIAAFRTKADTSMRFALYDSFEMPNGDWVCLLDFIKSINAQEKHDVFLKRYTSDFQEIWSQHLYHGDVGIQPTIVPSDDAFLLASTTTYQGILLKIKENGQTEWAKSVGGRVEQMCQLPNGNLLLLLSTSVTLGDLTLALLNPQGAFIKAVSIPKAINFSCVANPFPGGDILLNYVDANNVIVFHRLSADLKWLRGWEVYQLADNVGSRKLPLIISDSLLWLSIPGLHDGLLQTFFCTLDGHGRLLKCATIPEFFGGYGYPLNNTEPTRIGATGIISAALFNDEKFSLFGLGVVCFDTAMQIAGCPLPLHDCIQSRPAAYTVFPHTVVVTDIVPSNLQKTVAWQPWEFALEDYCPETQIPQPYFRLPDSICLGETVQPDAVSANPGSFWWTMQHENGEADSVFVSQPNFVFEKPGLWRVALQALDEKHCHVYSFSTTIEVLKKPGISLPAVTGLCMDSTLWLMPTITDVTDITWDDGTKGPARLVDSTGVYSLSVSNGICRASDSIQVVPKLCTVSRVYVPNVFSPNGSAENSQFRVFYNEVVEKVELVEIFSRWGEVVFYTASNEPWDGKFRGQAALSGVYAYRIRVRLTDGSTQTLNGDLTLVE